MKLTFLLLTLMRTIEIAAARDYFLYVGPYTKAKSTSKGIYAWRYDSNTAKLTPIGLAAETSNPSFLVAHPNGRFLYAVNENNDGAVSSISQRFPFTAGDHPVGGEGIFGRPAGAIRKGKWYYHRAENIVQHRFDHFDVVLGSKINMLDRSVEAAQRNLYRELCTFLRDL